MTDLPPQPPPKGLWATLRQLGPGMIIAGSIVGSGELIATTKVGAEAGFWLLWLIIIGCVIKVFCQIEFGRYTITWSQTPLKALNSVPGPKLKVNWLVWAWAFMTVPIIFQQGGIVGGVGQALAISAPLTEQGRSFNEARDGLVQAQVELAQDRLDTPSASFVEQENAIAVLAEQVGQMPEPADPYVWTALIAILTSFLLYFGRYKLIQAVSTVFVGLFSLMTIVTVIMLQQTSWAVTGAEFSQGLQFSVPPADPVLGINPIATAFAAFGIIGLGSAELIMYPYWCLEKGYAKLTGKRDGSSGWIERAKGWVRVLHIDAWGSMVVYTISTVAFYLLGAAVLWRIGLNPAGGDLVRTLAEMYVPVFGEWASSVFLFGAFAVLYSTFFVAAAGNARMVADGLGLYGFHANTEATRMRWTRIISAVWPLVAFVLYLFVQAPAAMVLAGGIGQGIMLPLLGIAALYFRYKRTEEALVPGRVWDVLLWISFGALCVAGGWTLYANLFG